MESNNPHEWLDATQEVLHARNRKASYYDLVEAAEHREAQEAAEHRTKARRDREEEADERSAENLTEKEILDDLKDREAADAFWSFYGQQVDRINRLGTRLQSRGQLIFSLGRAIIASNQFAGINRKDRLANLVSVAVLIWLFPVGAGLDVIFLGTVIQSLLVDQGFNSVYYLPLKFGVSLLLVLLDGGLAFIGMKARARHERTGKMMPLLFDHPKALGLIVPIGTFTLVVVGTLLVNFSFADPNWMRLLYAFGIGLVSGGLHYTVFRLAPLAAQGGTVVRNRIDELRISALNRRQTRDEGKVHRLWTNVRIARDRHNDASIYPVQVSASGHLHARAYRALSDVSALHDVDTI